MTQKQLAIETLMEERGTGQQGLGGYKVWVGLEGEGGRDQNVQGPSRWIAILEVTNTEDWEKTPQTCLAPGFTQTGKPSKALKVP